MSPKKTHRPIYQRHYACATDPFLHGSCSPFYRSDEKSLSATTDCRDWHLGCLRRHGLRSFWRRCRYGLECAIRFHVPIRWLCFGLFVGRPDSHRAHPWIERLGIPPIGRHFGGQLRFDLVQRVRGFVHVFLYKYDHALFGHRNFEHTLVCVGRQPPQRIGR